MNTTFDEVFKKLRHQIQSRAYAALFEQAGNRHVRLARYPDVDSVIRFMRDNLDVSDREEREAITRALIYENQICSGVFWSSVLLTAYYPMLKCLRQRIYGPGMDSQDLDQLVITSFLLVVKTYPLAKFTRQTMVRIRSDSTRLVYSAVLTEQNEERLKNIPIQTSEYFDPMELVPALIEISGRYLSKQDLGLVVTAAMGRGYLRRYLDKQNGAGFKSDERVYQRLKRKRTRKLKQLQNMVTA